MDLSSHIRASLDAELQKARQHVEEENYFEASDFYANCARLAQRLAKHITSKAGKKKMLEDAETYLQLSRKFRQGKVPRKGPAEPLTNEGGQEENFSELVSTFVKKSDICFSDIIGLDDVIKEVKLSYGLALAKSPIKGKFSNNSILLYGPPGTGKTLLAAAVSNKLDATFFSVSIGNVLSKYFGESSKIIEALYQYARQHSPAVIFFDEIDALAGNRENSDSGADRRVVNSLLSQVDGLESKSDDSFILTIASTNIPWSLDEALLSRFQSKVYIPLPTPDSREAILKLSLDQANVSSNIPLADISRDSVNFSGRELSQLCQHAIKSMILSSNSQLEKAIDAGLDSTRNYQIQSRPLSEIDWDKAFKKVNPISDSKTDLKFQNWLKRVGG